MQRDTEVKSVEAYRAAIDVLMCHAGFSFHEACQELNVQADTLMATGDWNPSQLSDEPLE